MTLTLTKPPEVNPIGLEAVKAHLRLPHDGDDAYLNTLVETSVHYLQNDLNRSLMTQEWTLVFRGSSPFSSFQTLGEEEASISLSYPPLQEVLSVHVLMPNAQKRPLRRFLVDITQERPLLRVVSKRAPLEVCYRTGYGDRAEQVPPPLRQALLLIVAHFYANRTLEIVKKDALLQELMAPYRLKKMV